MRATRRRVRRDLLLATAVVLTPTPGTAADFASGQEAWAQGRYGEARARWQACAGEGSADCQHALAVLLEQGPGGVADLRAAIPWYRRAASQDHRAALIRLGFLYATGDGVSQDPVQAWAWFARAAALGDPRARELRDRVGGLLTEEERLQAERLADALSIRYHLQK
jgi:TPR repeat protein